MSQYVLPLIVVAVLIALAVLGFFWWQYRQWPPVAWKAKLQSQIAEWEAKIAQVDNHPDAKKELALREQRLLAYEETIPLNRLADYPGIGQGTVQKLIDARFTKISQLWQLGWTSQVPGIGEVREKALKEAAKAIKIDAETKFDNGQCPEGQAWITEREKLRDSHRAESEQRDRVKAAAKKAIAEAQPLVRLAESVHFSNFLLHRQSSPITAEVMARPFPVMVVETAKASPPKNESPKPEPPISAPGPIQPPTPTLTLDDPAIDRLKTYTRFAFVIARADGRVAVAEKKDIRNFLFEQFGGDPRIMPHIDPMIERCENPPPIETDVIAEIKANIDSEEWPALLRAARSIADCSGDRNQKEQKLIDRIAEAFGESPTDIAPKIADPRTVLGIPEKAELTGELIRRRLNILLDQYDPGKAQALGAEFVAMAQAKREDVKAAADQLLKQIGEPDSSQPPPAKASTTPPPSDDLRHNPDLDAIFGS